MIARDDHQSHRPSSVEGSCPQIGAGPPSPSTPLVYSVTIWKAELNFLGDCDYDANSAPPDITPGDMTGKTTPLQISEPPKLGSSDTSSSTSSPAQADSTSASFGVYCEVKFGNRSVRTSVARPNTSPSWNATVVLEVDPSQIEPGGQNHMSCSRCCAVRASACRAMASTGTPAAVNWNG